MTYWTLLTPSKNTRNWLHRRELILLIVPIELSIAYLTYGKDPCEPLPIWTGTLVAGADYPVYIAFIFWSIIIKCNMLDGISIWCNLAGLSASKLYD